jgi:hypothetical protein
MDSVPLAYIRSNEPSYRIASQTAWKAAEPLFPVDSLRGLAVSVLLLFFILPARTGPAPSFIFIVATRTLVLTILVVYGVVRAGMGENPHASCRMK